MDNRHSNMSSDITMFWSTIEAYFKPYDLYMVPTSHTTLRHTDPKQNNLRAESPQVEHEYFMKSGVD